MKKLSKILYSLGVIWCCLVVFWYIVFIIVTFFADGIWEVLRVLNIFNIWNFIGNMILLSPALLFFGLSEWLVKKKI